MNSNVIQFYEPSQMNFILKNKNQFIVDRHVCSFCLEPVIKGKHVADSNLNLAICFSCIKLCKEKIDNS